MAVLIFGGWWANFTGPGVFQKEVYYDDVWSLDVASGTWTMLMVNGTGPSKRAAPAMAVWNNKLYVFGGNMWTKTFQEIYDDMYALALADSPTKVSTWTRIPTGKSAPTKRSHALFLAMPMKLTLVGGVGEQEEELFDAWTYTQALGWQELHTTAEGQEQSLTFNQYDTFALAGSAINSRVW